MMVEMVAMAMTVVVVMVMATIQYVHDDNANESYRDFGVGRDHVGYHIFRFPSRFLRIMKNKTVAG